MKGRKSETQRIREIFLERDRLRLEYSFFDPTHRERVLARDRSALSLLKKGGLRDLSGLDILDFGCGHGDWLIALLRWGCDPRKMTGLDLVRERIAAARLRLPLSVRLVIAGGGGLPFASDRFDLVIQSTVFSSILDGELRGRVAAELLRVLRPGGRILWYDLCVNNPANPQVRKIPLREIEGLFPGCSIHGGRRTLAPPIARLLAPRSPLLAQGLERIPAICSHRMALITKPRGGADAR